MPGRVSSVVNKIEMVRFIVESSEDTDKQVKGDSENINIHNDFTSIDPFRGIASWQKETRGIRTGEHLADFFRSVYRRSF